MKYLSTFTGIGGFELGIQQAYSRLEREQRTPVALSIGQETVNGSRMDTLQRDGHGGNGGQHCTYPACIGYSEIDKYAIQTYERHFEHVNYGDITKINTAELPDFDLIVGGFPCQAFSVAGKRLGFNETRGTLFFDLARILKDKRPGHFVFENVKGLLSHDNGKTFQTILGVLTDLGYLVEWQVLNSKDFGVPQNRERIYIVGHLGGACGRKIFPIRSSEAAIAQNDVQKRPRSGLRKLWRVGDSQESRRAVLSSHSIRRLTPRECERLQGFPDDWTAGVSDTQRYKQCGNAVTVNTVTEVMSRLKGCLL